jgi:hypothetical protein
VTDADRLADGDFHAARLRSIFRRALDVLSGRPRRLLSFEEVREKLHLTGPVHRRLETVRLDQIVGSVNRYRDFDRRFLPTQSHTYGRWHRVNRAWYRDLHLPPVMLYKVGEAYFVADGNHRVSVARAQGLTFIDAEVRECISRVPLTADVDPEGLERLGSRLEFLERTQIDRLRPEARIETSILGGYDRLLEHIAVHRVLLAEDFSRPVEEQEAVLHWYDHLYVPVVGVVERSGLLDELPGRTATDLYLWIMDHHHYLRSLPGQGHVDARDAARDFIEQMD